MTQALGARGRGKPGTGTRKCEKQSGNSAGVDCAGPGGKSKEFDVYCKTTVTETWASGQICPVKRACSLLDGVLPLGRERGWSIGAIRNHHLSVRGTVSGEGVRLTTGLQRWAGRTSLGPQLSCYRTPGHH